MRGPEQLQGRKIVSPAPNGAIGGDAHLLEQGRFLLCPVAASGQASAQLTALTGKKHPGPGVEVQPHLGLHTLPFLLLTFLLLRAGASEAREEGKGRKDAVGLLVYWLLAAP